MAATPTTKSQVQAYRFVLRRMEHALVRKDAVMLHDPMRTQIRATAIGAVIGVLLLAGFALVSVFRPADDVSGDTILMGRTSLTLLVARDEQGTRVLHPVLNLASARLVAGEPAAVSIVDDAALAGLPRGPLLGIAGAPDALPETANRPDPAWTVCDRVDEGTGGASRGGASVTTTVLSGALAGGVRTMAGGEALFVLAPDGSRQLLFDGKRAVVDPAKAAVARELGLSSAVARPASAGLLNAVPEVPALDVPGVPGAGQKPSYPVGEAVVGDVVDVRSVAGTDYYLILPDGVQPVEPLVAGLLATGSKGFLDVGTDVMGQVPNSSRPIDVSGYPAETPTLLDAAEDPVGCLRWEPNPDQVNSARAPFRGTVLVGSVLPVPEDARVVPVAAAGGASSSADGFYLRPGQGAVVQTERGPGTRYLITDTGTRYGIDTAETARVLGLGEAAQPAPASILSLLPQGPGLDANSALRAQNGLAPTRPAG